MRLVAMSDTHGKHAHVMVPDGDVLVHAGDATPNGKIVDVKKFAGWYGSLPHAHKIFVAGNHDFGFENEDQEKCRKIIRDNGITYLQDQACIINGLKFYGSPWQPDFHNWAFNLPRGTALKAVWNRIPLDTDVLITHGPPHGMMDRTEQGLNVGCMDLMLRLPDLRLRAHIFGHIHEGYGIKVGLIATYVNASICTPAYNATNAPIVVDV